MKLLLCSWASHRNKKLEKTFLNLLSKPINENKLILLSMDTTSESQTRFISQAINWYRETGFKEKTLAYST
jgi:hypothetical protein